MVALENKGLALRLAVDSLKSDVTIASVDDAERYVLPLAERYHAWLEGESVEAAPQNEATASRPSGQDAVEAIREAVQNNANDLGGTVNALVNDGIRSLGGATYDDVINNALSLIETYRGELGSRNANNLRTIVGGLR